MRIKIFFKKSCRALKKLIMASPKDKVWLILNGYIPELSLAYQRWFNFNGKFDFENRARGQKKLLIVVAGYKDFLWEVVFGRIKKFLDNDIDVCILSPGLVDKRLQNIAKKNNWSYLSTKENKLSLAQNIAIKLHPKAKLIYKLDEDIFITKNYFSNLERTLLEIKKDDIYHPGFVAPVINVNGFTYIHFLKQISKEKEYYQKFGELRVACMGVKAHYDPKAGIFLWEKSLPLDQIAKNFSKNYNYVVIPHRFSIGAILFERKLWEEMGFFKVALKGSLGLEEEELCRFCHLESYPGFVSLNTLVGHFGFGPQNEEMKKFFLANKAKFLE